MTLAGWVHWRWQPRSELKTGWSLTAADRASPGISLIGFDLDQVRAACVQHGWRFE